MPGERSEGPHERNSWHVAGRRGKTGYAVPHCATSPPHSVTLSHFTGTLCRSKPWPDHICQERVLRQKPGATDAPLLFCGYGLLLNGWEVSPQTNRGL